MKKLIIVLVLLITSCRFEASKMAFVPGFVVESNVDSAWVENFITEHRPTTMLFINRPDLASLASDLGVPNSILRIKTGSINDDQLHVLFRDAREWWETVQGEYQDKRLIVYVGNELNGDWGKINRFLSDAVDIIAASGRRGVYGNFGVGNPEPEYWQTFLSGLVKRLEETPNQYLGLHEYYIQHPFLGMDGYVWENGLVDSTPDVSIENRTKWILGRYEFVLKTAPKIQIMITEFGADHVSAVASQYGFPDSMRGWRTQYGSETEAFAHFNLAIKTFYDHPNVRGVLFFIMGGFGWEDFNFQNANTILSRWNELEVHDMAGATTPRNVDVEIVATSTNYNIRSSAPSGSVVGGTRSTVPTVTRVFWIESVTGLDNSGNAWEHFSGIPSVGEGWIRADGIIITSIPEPPPVYDEDFITLPIPEMYLGGMTEREREIVVSILRWIGLSSDSLADYIEAKQD